MKSADRSLAVMLVEDSPSDAALLEESLNEAEPGRFKVTCVETLAGAIERLRHDPFDVVLLDLSLPDSTGRDTFLRAHAAAPELPIIVLTGVKNELTSSDALGHGIQDYLIKSEASGGHIARAIRHALERKRVEANVVRAQGELRRARDELELRVQERTADLRQAVAILKTQVALRKQAECALKESEERYRALFEAAPVGIGLYDRRGKLIALNARLCAMTGLSPAEARALPLPALHATPAQWRRLNSQMRKFSHLPQQEVHLRRKDGSAFLARVRMDRLQLGRQCLVTMIAEDITQQRQIESDVEGVRGLLELFATKTSLQDYVKSAVRLLRDWFGAQCAGIRLLDSRGRIPFAARTGYDREFVRRESRLCLGTDDCACVRIFNRKPRAADQPFTSQNGSFFCDDAGRMADRLCAGPLDFARAACIKQGYNSLIHSPIRYHGRLLGSIHLADLRAGRFRRETIRLVESVAPLVGEAIHRFQVEASLQESEQRFRFMFERNQAAMLLVEPRSGNIEDANPAAAAFYGFARERLRTMKIDELHVPARGPEMSRRSRMPAMGEEGAVFLHRLPGGDQRTIEVHSSPIRVKGRNLRFSIVHDITERKLLEKQVLDISQRERERLGRDLHDSLGGRLTGAALMGKALARRLEGKGTPEEALARELVSCINQAISQTRAIARGLCPVELSAAGLLSGLQEFASLTEKSSGISCHFESEGDVRIRDNPTEAHLFRIVQEAVSNALRHSGARRITIRLARNQGHILVEVRDDGRGLPARAPVNAGMGLRTMQYRANIIGAQLSVRSGQDGGTVMACELPLLKGSRKPVEPAV